MAPASEQGDEQGRTDGPDAPRRGPRARRAFRAAALTLLAAGVLVLGLLQREPAVPVPAASVAVLSESRLCPAVTDALRDWTPRQRVAQQVIAYLPPGAEDEAARAGLGGVLITRDHGTRIDALRATTERLRPTTEPAAPLPTAPPPLLATDQEGGWVTRIVDPRLELYPSNREIGAAPRGAALERVRRQGADFATALRAAGVDVNFAPVVDIATADSEIISRFGRAYSDDPAVVAELSRAFVGALQAGGVAATLKHFPGHGMVVEDSHVALPRTAVAPDVLERVHLRPYRELLANPATDPELLLVMTSHVLFEALDPAAPASLSRTVTTDLLRRDLGYDGVVVTDALGMGALDGSLPERAVRALAAGADMVLLEAGAAAQLPAVLAALEAAYESGALAWRANAAALERILRLKRALGLVADPADCIPSW